MRMHCVKDNGPDEELRVEVDGEPMDVLYGEGGRVPGPGQAGHPCYPTNPL